jgi:S1-C subfamily serine protease
MTVVVWSVTALTSIGSADDSSSDVLRVNSTAVRSEFAEVCDIARHATVRIQSQGQDVAIGTIVAAEGLILSKASELPSDKLTCHLTDGRVLDAVVAARHAGHDLALLRINVDNLPVIEWSDDLTPSVGKWVVTPSQDTLPVAVGVVSVESREVPRERVKGILALTLEDRDGTPQIQSVHPESGLVGLSVGDRIEGATGEVFGSPEALLDYVAQHQAGDTLTLAVLRGAKRINVTATLIRPFGEFLPRSARLQAMGGRLSDCRSGFAQAIQHDTVLTPEQCGGPLLDLSGKAIGINIARASRTKSYALPSDLVRTAIDEMLRSSPNRSLLVGGSSTRSASVLAP